MKRRNLAPALSLCLGVLVALGNVPAAAQVDLSGVWTIRLHEDEPERGPGAGYGNYTGLPVNDDARQRGMSWHPSLHNVPEHQCVPLSPEYNNRWSNQQIWKEQDPVTGDVIAWHLHKSWQEQYRVFWMDGRARPPEGSPHTFQGFSTAKWDGDKLVVMTTHVKEGPIRRNGIQHSDRATLIEHFVRHGDHLMVSSILKDPVYFTEPLIHTSNYVLSIIDEIDPYPCEVVTEIATQGKGYVPHFVPWGDTPPRVERDRARRGVSLETWFGGAETMYPEYVYRIYPDYVSGVR